MGLFPPESAFRISVTKVVRHPRFDPFILVLIMISSMMLAIENPLWDPTSSISTAFFFIDVVMTILFTGEMVLKVTTASVARCLL